jgi:hypothetical protein
MRDVSQKPLLAHTIVLAKATNMQQTCGIASYGAAKTFDELLPESLTGNPQQGYVRSGGLRRNPNASTLATRRSTMSVQNPKELFVRLLSDLRIGTERSIKFYQELSQLARIPT